MIHGIGTDIVAMARMTDLHRRYGDKLAARILAPEEQNAYIQAGTKAVFLAKRFAAKEAFAKAVGSGMRAPVHFDAIRITHDALGKPGLEFAPHLARWLQDRGVGRAHLSLSDEQEYAVAFVILESRESP